MCVRETLEGFVATRVIADQLASGRYLARGDVVDAAGTNLGTIHITID